MKKHLLVTTDCFLPRWDGIARFLKELLPIFAKEFDITVLAPKFQGKPPSMPGIKIQRCPLTGIKFGDIQFSKAGKKTVEKQVLKADVVFNQTIGPIGITTINTAKKLGKPIASYVHSIEWELASTAVKHGKPIARLLVKMLAKNLYNKCDILFTPTAEASNTLSAHGILTRKIITPLSVDTKKFKPLASKTMAKKAIGIDPRTLVVGFCGRIAREKDLPTLIHAFQKLKNKHNAKLLIIGTGIEEKEFKDRQIILAGRTDNVVPYLQAMDVFVLPSLTETSSLATMEAMSCGVPVIATPVGAVKEYVQEGKNGMFFARKDSNALAEKIETLFKNKKMRETLGKNARKTMEQRTTWKETARKILHYLHELAK